MNVQTTQMDPRIAAIHYKDYRKKVRQHREQRIAAAKAQITDGNKLRRSAYADISLIEKEDTILMDCYREMAKGQRVLNLASVMASAGRNKQQLPVLSVAQANWKECFLTVQNPGQMAIFSADRWTSYSYAKKKWANDAVAIPSHTFGAELSNAEWRKGQGHPALPVSALVPAIPLHLRPAGDLSEFHILWEAVWTPTKAPEDPLLLKHIRGFMYTVLAQWDLTPIEQMVLEGRLT